LEKCRKPCHVRVKKFMMISHFNNTLSETAN
jgi:hypothetical protein